MKKFNLFNYNNLVLKEDNIGTVGEIEQENDNQGVVEKGGKLEMSHVQEILLLIYLKIYGKEKW